MNSQEHDLLVVKRNGKKEPLQLSKLHRMVISACDGLTGTFPSQIEMKSSIQFYNGMTTEEIQQILIRSAVDLISLESPNYQYAAARLLLYSLRKAQWGSEQPPHILDHVKQNISLGVYDMALLEYYDQEEWEKINSFVKHDRDYNFTHSGLKQCVDKYLVQDRIRKTIFETPQFMYMLISACLFSSYPRETRLKYVKDYYDAISQFKISLPTPIIAGVRTPLRQFASCILFDMDDNLDSIFNTGSAMGYYVAQRAGIGMNMGRIRGKGAKIRNGEVEHTGVIPFARNIESIAHSCTQSGIRGGAVTCHFPFFHWEIEDILQMKNNQGSEDNSVRDIDYSIGLSKIVYQRYIEDSHITLFSNEQTPGLYESFGSHSFDDLYVKYEQTSGIRKKKISAREFVHTLLNERFETGRVYIYNADHCNSHSHTQLPVYMSNLCVSGDTKITILDHSNYQKDISIKDLQTSPDGNWRKCKVFCYNNIANSFQFCEIKNFAMTNKSAKTLTIHYQGKKLTCTPEHKIYTLNRGYIEAQDLNENDQLLLSRKSFLTYSNRDHFRIEYNETEIPVYDITVEDNHNFFANDILVHNCQEILLPTHPINSVNDEDGMVATCILSALNVGTIKENEYEKICDLAVRALDELIDYQGYPLPSANNYTKNQRTLGIGVINYAYALAKNKMEWESKEAYQFTHELFENIQYNLIKASTNLAKEKGPASGFDTSKYAQGILPIDTYKPEVDTLGNFKYLQDWNSLRKEIAEHGMRNCSLTAIAPTESSSVTSGATSGIDPVRDHLTIKRSKRGDLKVLVPEYQRLKNFYKKLWDMESMTGYISNLAIMQKFLDQSISANTSYNPLHFKDQTVTLDRLVHDLFLAYRLGLKTLYYCNTYDLNANDQIEEEDDGCSSGACRI